MFLYIQYSSCIAKHSYGQESIVSVGLRVFPFSSQRTLKVSKYRKQIDVFDSSKKQMNHTQNSIMSVFHNLHSRFTDLQRGLFITVAKHQISIISIGKSLYHYFGNKHQVLVIKNLNLLEVYDSKTLCARVLKLIT